MTTLICAGGSGTRVLEAVLHLCAAGLGPQVLRILVIDPDASNGNGARAKDVLNKYMECRKWFGGKGGASPFFATDLDLLTTQEGDEGLKTWSPVGANKKFNEILNYPLLPKTDRDVVDLFFTDTELKMDMNVGFRGHPAVGAAAMSLLSLYRRQKPWNQLDEKIRSEVAEPAGARVVIAGSVFGGTGASTIHPLARFLRSIPQQNAERLKIASIALVPYFQFKASTGGDGRAPELAAKSEWFALATRSAAQFYHHLRENKDWDFDAMYWLGDDSLLEVEYQVGGPQQENPAHFVDLLAGIAALDFFSAPVGTKACHFAGPAPCKDEQLKNRNVLEWNDIPLTSMQRDTIRTRMLQFYLAGAFHVGFLKDLFEDDRVDTKAYCIPWYLDCFVKNGQRLTTPENRDALKKLAEFFTGWHFPWCTQIHELELERVRLFNRAALLKGNNGDAKIDMYRLANLLWPNRPDGSDARKVDKMFSDMVEVSNRAVGSTAISTYLALLGQASERFVEREYKRKES